MADKLPSLRIVLEGDGAFPELQGRKIHHTTEPIVVTAFPRGMASGKPSVALVVHLEDGSAVFCETSLALFLTVADALKARHGDPR